MLKSGSVRKLLGEIWRGGKATPLRGTRNFHAAQVNAYSRAPGVAPSGGRMDQLAQKVRAKFDASDAELTRVNDNWLQYRNSFSNPAARYALSTARFGTGVLRDAPKSLLYLPTSGTGILGGTALYTGAGLISNGHLNIDPYGRAGQLAFNTMGNPENVVRQGFMQGLDTGVGQSLDHFNQLDFSGRQNYLMGGGAQQYARQNALNSKYQSRLQNGTVANTYNPSVGSRIALGDFDKNFYRDKAYQTAGQHLTKSGFIKRASLVSRAGNFAMRPLRAIGNSFQNKVQPLAPVTGNRGWRTAKHMAGSYGLPAAAVAGAAGMSYSDTKNQAFQGGAEAGYDTGLQQVGQQMGGLDLMSQLGALFAPQMAAQTGYDRYMQMRQGLMSNAQSGNQQVTQAVPQAAPPANTMYYYPNGEARY